MKTYCSRPQQGFSLVELLAVVLVLAVLAAVAVPLYMSSRVSAAARACRANITAIAAAETAFAVRHMRYTADMSEMVGAVEGFAEEPKCPETRGPYTLALVTAANPFASSRQAVQISCDGAALHAVQVGSTVDYDRVLQPPANEPIP